MNFTVIQFLNFNGWDSNQVLKAMRESVSTKPAIFAMSNPTMNGLFVHGLSRNHNFLICLWLLFWLFLIVISGTAECSAADAFKHAGENIVFASGSPFQNVDLGNNLLIWLFGLMFETLSILSELDFPLLWWYIGLF